ncbi:DUF3560 domain-containing protein [Krasilnikovia sp. M28-CT-15]|uniref:DUF3560 domain-containing protein n=1 Tax=Krasilnikovia sp. M28-CT-15 TaxID=3373540 RepID=UPI0038773472
MIVISHSHEEGTVLSGSRKGDGVYDIVKQHGFRWSRQVGIYMRGSRDRDAPRSRIDAAAQALREAGFDVVVEIDDQWRPAAIREAATADRADERADLYEERADRAAGRRDARHDAAHRTLDGIPAGQPMMPNHRSYAADRNRRERAWANLDAARAEDSAAGHYADKAAGVRAHADAMDNPRVIMRRVETLQADLRRWQRELAEAETVHASEQYQDRCRREIARLTENITHQQAKLADRAATGAFIAWGPDTLAKGDVVRGEFGWFRVTRVNRKSVSLDNGNDWPQRLSFDKIYGRRRDGVQLDTPNGQPWPVDLAVKVARWQRIACAATNPGYDEGQQRQARHARYARRLLHGLDLGASDSQVQAFWPSGDDPETLAERRRLSAAYLDVYERLEADERVPDIIASLTTDPAVPVWVMPDGDPVDRHPHDLHVGDIVAGLWDTGPQGRKLWPHFTGPVAAISEPVARDGRSWVTVTLIDGASREFATTHWLAVHLAPAA